jgi:two-component system chemotaxis response regulator CheB
MGCPDCRGVLGMREIGERGLLWFRCLIGHGFSTESLVQAKEEQMEGALWTAIELLHEVAMLHGELALRARKTRSHDQARAYQQRAAVALKHEAELRRITTQDGPAKPARTR